MVASIRRYIKADLPEIVNLSESCFRIVFSS